METVTEQNTSSVDVNTAKVGSKSIRLPPIKPEWLKKEIAANKDFVFKYDITQEPLLNASDKYERYKVRPIRLPEIHKMYLQGLATHWTAEEMDLTQDMEDWKTKLNENEKTYIKKILVYFLSSDSALGENAILYFMKIFPRWEIQQFYMWQAFNELIHSNTYALLVETFITDEKELSDAFDAIEKDEGVKAKADLVIKWVEDASVTPHEKLVAFAFTESVFFSGSFSSIGWIKQYKHVMERALVWSNDKISTDEALHCKNSFTIYNMLRDKLPAWRVYQIGCEFVEKEFQFIENTLQVDLIGMNSSLLKQYIMFVADVTLKWLGYQPIYKVKNPFPWMDKWSMDGLTSFFEKRSSEYQLPGVMNEKKSNKRIKSDQDVEANTSKKKKFSKEEDYLDYIIEVHDF